MYVYYEDDGKISYMEKASLQNILKSKDFHITEKEKQYLISLSDERVHKVIVYQYIKEHQLHYDMVMKAIKIVEEVSRKPIYIEIITGFKNDYIRLNS